MPTSHVIDPISEPLLARFAEQVAFAVQPGDLITLSGDLGTGKTTFARAVISALSNGAQEEIPSPTFTLVQTYETPRMTVAHFDLYRLIEPSELDELGLDHALKSGIALVEWPERAGGILPHNRLDVSLEDVAPVEASVEPDTRRLTLTGHGTWKDRLKRLVAMRRVIEQAGRANETCSLHYLQGDASVRRYARFTCPEQSGALLMDWPHQPDGPPVRNGLHYSRIAHLAEGVGPFVAVANSLRTAGLSVPQIYAHDLDNGFLAIEDLGDRVFGREVQTGLSDQAELWRAATDVLIALRSTPPPEQLALPDGSSLPLPAYDAGALGIEIELLCDWYWPMVQGHNAPESERSEFLQIWSQIFDRIAVLPPAWVLRDYHSPNLLWLPEREGIARVGVIDFQDAMRGPAAYDLVSLLQDARTDVAPELEATLFAHYCAGVRARDSEFDRDAFAFAYAALGAQRNTKILGIFARLANRDGKPGYLQHLPRIWRHLERNLSHPELGTLRGWYERNLPAGIRQSVANG